MRRFFFFSLSLSALLAIGNARAQEASLTGTTGLLSVPTARTLASGDGRFGASRYNPTLGPGASVDNFYFGFGFLPNLELMGRVVAIAPGGGNDLSANAKYAIDLPWGAALAVGGQDIGGLAQHYRSYYGAASVPWHSLEFTAGYGSGPQSLKGAFGGVEWRPVSWLGVDVEHDTQAFNEGLKLSTPMLGPGVRLAATAMIRGETHKTEYGAHLEWRFGGTPAAPKPIVLHPSDDSIRPALEAAGFEAVQVGRTSTTQEVRLENRSYNRSSADGFGVALGIVAQRTDPALKDIRITTSTYGVPQASVRVPADLARAWLADPQAHAAEMHEALHLEFGEGATGAEPVSWDEGGFLKGTELVLEPVLRTFVATEYGVLDYSTALRPRLVAPLSDGLIFNLAADVPVAKTKDFEDGQNFDSLAAFGGIDLILLQYAHKPTSNTTWLWSAGNSTVYRDYLQTVALEQAWVSDSGANRLRTKFMFLHSSYGDHSVALAGYTWYDAARDYSLGLTAGRFYANDGGWQAELNRYFGDTIVSLFFKAASADDMAGGFRITMPLTPRRDAQPGLMQFKGPRRWGHQLASTVHTYNGVNSLRPLLLYEPSLDLDLRRDFYDSGRLGEDYLREELPRMHEAWEKFGN